LEPGRNRPADPPIDRWPEVTADSDPRRMTSSGSMEEAVVVRGLHKRYDDVRVLGVDPESGGRALRERIGIVTQESGVGQDFTVRETIQLFSAAYPEPLRTDDAAELVGLED